MPFAKNMGKSISKSITKNAIGIYLQKKDKKLLMNVDYNNGVFKSRKVSKNPQQNNPEKVANENVIYLQREDKKLLIILVLI